MSNATETLYHGSHKHLTGLVLHCLTSDEDVAETYAKGGEVYEMTIDLSELTVAVAPDYDHDSNDCAADHEDYRAQRAAEGIDVLRYEDEDEMGWAHTCYRLLTARAIAAVTVSA